MIKKKKGTNPEARETTAASTKPQGAMSTGSRYSPTADDTKPPTLICSDLGLQSGVWVRRVGFGD